MYQQNNRKARLYKHLFHSYEDNQNAKEREKKKHFTFLSDKAMQASEQKSQYQTTNKHRDPFRIDSDIMSKSEFGPNSTQQNQLVR